MKKLPEMVYFSFGKYCLTERGGGNKRLFVKGANFPLVSPLFIEPLGLSLFTEMFQVGSKCQSIFY